MSKFLNQLYEEHRLIGAVLHGMRYLIDSKRERNQHVDTKVFRAMLYYLDVFPERVHHRKEEEILFRALRHHPDESGGAIDDLRREHESGERAIRGLEQALVRFEEGGDAEFAAFATAADHYIARYWDHMSREERVVMPLAEKVLSIEEWREIEAAFARDQDPLKGASTEDYRELFSRIVNIAPPPIGLGAG